jgi:hypothetical protein
MSNAPRPRAEPPPLSSRGEFAAALRWALAEADARNARNLLWIDPDFEPWPLDDPALLEALTRWLQRPQRRLTMLAEHYELVPGAHARFTGWRRHWSHALDARLRGEEETGILPTLVLDDGPVCVELIDRAHWRGRCSFDARQAQHWREQTDVLIQRSTPGFPVSHLGL